MCLFHRALPPASFVYGGESSEAILGKWARSEKRVQDTERSEIYETTWQEPDNGLTAIWRAEVFKDRPAMEFRWVFENHGKQPTRSITDVFAIHLLIGKSNVQLVRSSGGLTGPFTGEPPAFVVSQSAVTAPLTLSAAGGRSSNKDLPFFVLHDNTAAEGLYFGVGWSGQWQADFRPDAITNRLRMTVGMPGMKLRLPVGERILSPSVLVGSYLGDSQTGSNALRRILYDHYVALLGNRKPLPPVSWNHWFTFENRISEDMLKQQVDAAADLGLEYFCIDSGWFDGEFPCGVGNWTLDRKKFPQGLKPIGQYVASKGMKLGLWFEPSRAEPPTRLSREHPKWVRGNQVAYDNPEACQWLFKMMCDFIDEGNVRWIRYDYNHDPLDTWNKNDTPDTQGLTQIRYLIGEYELFDRLRQRYPDLLIESCASGGRRIDLETIRRAHTFWKSDETNNLIAARSQETGGNQFLPGVLLNTNLPAWCQPTSFELHSLFAGPLGFATNWTKIDTEKRNRVRDAISQFKSLRHLLNEDYYPLFPQTVDLTQWVGWEFIDPKTQEGMAIAIRPSASAYMTAKVRLRGISREATYRMERFGDTNSQTLSGSDLLSGFPVTLPEDGSVVFHFRRVAPDR